MKSEFSIGQCANLACLWEVVIPKPGNVHRGADFEDATFADFVTAAVVLGPILETAIERPVGHTVLDCVKAVRRVTPTNTHLGTILLLAPLASAPRDRALCAGIPIVLGGLSIDDSRRVYEAIRTAEPGGLGRVDKMDIADEPPEDLLVAMEAAAGHDLIARQYVDKFAQVFVAAEWLRDGIESGWNLTDAVVHCHVRLMCDFPDSLIARKCGQETALESSARAATALDAGSPGEENYEMAVADLDFWLRSDGHRRNPGTTADMIAAALFVQLRDGHLRPPFPKFV